MKFTTFLHKQLSDLVEDRRVVVWYDAEGDFGDFVRSFNAPNCEVISAATSLLKARRRADEVYRLMNESEKPSEAARCMLIYVPRHRGATEEGKMRDPFEVYALAGAAFGDAPAEKLESIAKQAMPERADEINRLFREGHPTIGLLDGLEKTQRYPVLDQVLKTESTSEVIALALCDEGRASAIDETPGCVDELIRLLAAVGFKPGKGGKKWADMRRHAAAYVLFSEFVFDLPVEPPDALSAVERAPEDAKPLIFAACERMRSNVELRDTYMALAVQVENDLRLAHIAAEIDDPGAIDTFPFEERLLLRRLVRHAEAAELDVVSVLLSGRRKSVWRHDPERSPLWTAAERGAALLATAIRVSNETKGIRNLNDLVSAYAEHRASDLDRYERLFENALTACEDYAELTPLVELCRRRYRDAALRMQDQFLEAVGREGWPPERVPRQTRVFDDHVAPALEAREKVAYFMVDSLRYEMGRDLGEALARVGEERIGYAASVFPTITDCGMAALLPKADGVFRLVEKDGEVFTALGTRLLKTSGDRMKLLKEHYGDRFRDVTLDDMLGMSRNRRSKLGQVDLLVVRTQDPDIIGENLGVYRARKYLSDVIGDIMSAVKIVIEAGFKRIVVSSDHGHIQLPEILPGDVVSEPEGTWVKRKRRCRLGGGLSSGSGTVTLKAERLGVSGDIEDACIPLGFKVFSEGSTYFHGGMSLQEALVPVITLLSRGGEIAEGGKPEIEVRYRSDKFTTRVIGLNILYRGDMFGTPVSVRVDAYDGPTAKAKPVGEAADCDARDEKTREVRLEPDEETPVPVLIDPDFEGPEVEIRISDPETRVVWAALRLKNAMMD